jgi:hypothetical protein
MLFTPEDAPLIKFSDVVRSKHPQKTPKLDRARTLL